MCQPDDALGFEFYTLILDFSINDIITRYTQVHDTQQLQIILLGFSYCVFQILCEYTLVYLYKFLKYIKILINIGIYCFVLNIFDKLNQIIKNNI